MLVLAHAGQAPAWDIATHEKMAALAVRLMPPALGGQLVKNREALLEGVRAPDRESAPESHALQADGTGGALDQEVARRVEAAIALVRGQGSFADLARLLGEISHFAADATFPLNTSSADARARAYYADYAAYAGSKLEKFPPIFGGYRDLDRLDPVAYVRELAERANRGYFLVSRSYFPDGASAMKSSRTFDDRGPAFGIAQIGFGSGVSATANLWLYVWREAHGNLTNTPHYAPARRIGLAPDRTRAPQRF